MLSRGIAAGWLDSWFPRIRDKMDIATPAAGERRGGGTVHWKMAHLLEDDLGGQTMAIRPGDRSGCDASDDLR